MPQSTVWNQDDICFLSRTGQKIIQQLPSAVTASSTQPILYFLTSPPPALAWAIWHEMRLPVDTDPKTLLHIHFLPVPPLNLPQHYTPPDGFHFYLGVDTHLNTELRSVPEGNFNTGAAWFTVKY